tara:strand:- start:3859 stop:4302 length:444 start_codon:yes stop_codon:yes gene_type:complete
MQLTGTVTSGLGRAHVFMAQSHYQDQFKSVLGNTAWPGTLNVDVKGSDLEKYRTLRIISGLEDGDVVDGPSPKRIVGFERDGKSFGGATAFIAEITIEGGNSSTCAILIPDLTRHTETAEVISTSFLREVLPCEDGTIVKIQLNSQI